MTARTFAGADHSLCRSEVGSRKEAIVRTPKSDAAPDFVPGHLDRMTAWLRQRFGP